MKGGAASERALVLAPRGRDASIAVGILTGAGLPALACADLADLVGRLEEGAALALVAEEAMAGADLTNLARWIAAQPAWSDFPILVLTQLDRRR